MPVRRNIVPTRAPLTAAIQELLSLGGPFLGEAGLYNALYQSDLQVQAVSVRNGRAIIELVGTYRIRGVCDAPRVEAQFEQTVVQFATVDDVQVFINDVPLETLNSQR